jgi:hypothetical protein
MVEIKDFIQGNRFADMADFTFSPEQKHMDDYYNLPNTMVFCRLKDINIVFTTPFYAMELMGVIRKLGDYWKFIVVTHNGDNEVNDNGVGYMDGKGNYIKTDEFTVPANVIKWYATNVNTLAPWVEAIPSGLENDRWRPELRKKERMMETWQQPKDIRNLVYVDFSTTWNVGERKRIYSLLEGKPWVTSFRDGANFERFLDNVYNHKFVVCPRGNGIATHREWETLYMGSIPIMKRDLNNRFFTNLPICFVDDWAEVTEEFLNSEFLRITMAEWDEKILTFDYWKNKIRNTI